MNNNHEIASHWKICVQRVSICMIYTYSVFVGSMNTFNIYALAREVSTAGCSKQAY